MDTLKNLDTLASSLLAQLPELMKQGTIYGSDLLQRFIKYSLISETIGLTMLVILFFIAIYLTKKQIKWVKRESEGDSDRMHSFGFTVIAFIILFIYFFSSLNAIIQILTVPEIYLLHYFK